jgi:hypothetical protein
MIRTGRTKDSMITEVAYGQRTPPGVMLPPWFPKPISKMRQKQAGMLWVPQKGILRCEHSLGNTPGTTIGTAVTTGGSSGTKGSAAQLIASTAFDAYWIRVVAMGYAAAATTSQCCLDILAGAATEEVIIPDLLAGFCGGAVSITAGGPKVWDFPLYIPAGTRIAARAAGDRVSTAFRVAVFLYGGNGYPAFRAGGKVRTYGVSVVPGGTDVAAGYTGAEGAWVQIAAASSEDHFAFVPSFSPSDGDTTLTPTKHVFMDMGIGAATEELLIGAQQSYCWRYDVTEICEGPYNSMPTFHDVPSGTRLVARLSMSGATDTGEPDCAIHGVS